MKFEKEVRKQKNQRRSKRWKIKMNKTRWKLRSWQKSLAF